MKEKKKTQESQVTTHREAFKDYFILEKLEAGIVLKGCEVKSLRTATVNLSGSFARLVGSEVFLYNCYIAPYLMGGLQEMDPNRERKLLLHRKEIEKLKVKTAEKGLVLIPLRIYFNHHGMAKLEFGICRGKKLYDKRADIKKQAVSREIDRAVKNRNRK